MSREMPTSPLEEELGQLGIPEEVDGGKLDTLRYLMSGLHGEILWLKKCLINGGVTGVKVDSI